MTPACSSPSLRLVATAALSLVACPAAPAPAFTGAPYSDGHFANLYPFRLPSAGDLVDWY